MLLRIQLLLRRIRGFELKRVKVYIDSVKRESRMPRFLILLDMLFCILLYGVGFFDYHIFGFAHIHSPKKRRTFFTMKDNWRLCRLVNAPEDKPYFTDKRQFCRAFRDMLGRDFLDVEKAAPEALAAFLKAHPVVFLKPPAGFGGLGVERFDARGTDTDDLAQIAALRTRWCTQGLTHAEEALTQHPALSALYPSSLNTLRVCTLTGKDGEAHVLYSFLRTGRGGAVVDNTTSGGLSALICPDGVIRKPALSDKSGHYFEHHPDTGTLFIGFSVPYYEEALALCRRACKVRPGMRYVGWDVGITPDGPVLVEGNDLPAYDGQIYHQVEKPGTGLRPLIRSIVPEL